MNNRISGGPTDDPIYPHGTWPTQKMCDNCYEENGIIETKNEDAILNFIINFYSAERVSNEHILVKEKSDDLRSNLKPKNEL